VLNLDQLPKTLLDTVREKRIDRYRSGLCLVWSDVDHCGILTAIVQVAIRLWMAR